MSVRKLSLIDVIMHRQGSFVVRLIHVVFAIVTSIFFRRIELFNSENLPRAGGVIFVSNHPNALIDPLLLFVALPRRIAFLAKSTLFKMPVIGLLIRHVGALPLYRQQDKGQDISKNAETFTLARELLKKGGAIAIFPEGVSHDAPKLMPLKTGAARIGLGAISVGQNPASLHLKIVPIGIFYTNKTKFRSEALLYFGDSIDVNPVALDAAGLPSKEDVTDLTEKIDSALRRVTINAETDRELEIARIAEEVFTAITPEKENLAQRQNLIRKFVDEPLSENEAIIEARLAEYDGELNKLKLKSEFLNLPEYSKRYVLKETLLRSWYLIIAAPLAIFGIILHFPAYRICEFLAYLETRKNQLDMMLTVKVISGFVLIPLTWLIFAAIIFHYFGLKIALLSIPFSFFCGYIGLRSIEEANELRDWLNAISKFFLKRQKFLRLFAKRESLYETLKSEK